MESNDELKEIDINNRAYCYFDDIIKIEDFDFDNILVNKKSYKDILVYDMSYKTLIDVKPLRNTFDKVDRFIRVDGGTRYLVLLRTEKYDATFNRITYLVSQKSGITYIISHNYPRIKIYLYDSLLLEKTVTFHNVISLINPTQDGPFPGCLRMGGTRRVSSLTSVDIFYNDKTWYNYTLPK